jgi:hypothetical protein
MDLIFGLRIKYKQNWAPPFSFGLFSAVIVMLVFTSYVTEFFVSAPLEGRATIHTRWTHKAKL